jgi:hypothetical protein
LNLFDVMTRLKLHSNPGATGDQAE